MRRVGRGGAAGLWAGLVRTWPSRVNGERTKKKSVKCFPGLARTTMVWRTRLQSSRPGSGLRRGRGETPGLGEGCCLGSLELGSRGTSAPAAAPGAQAAGEGVGGPWGRGPPASPAPAQGSPRGGCRRTAPRGRGHWSLSDGGSPARGGGGQGAGAQRGVTAVTGDGPEGSRLTERRAQPFHSV